MASRLGVLAEISETYNSTEKEIVNNVPGDQSESDKHKVTSYISEYKEAAYNDTTIKISYSSALHKSGFISQLEYVTLNNALQQIQFDWTNNRMKKAVNLGNVFEINQDRLSELVSNDIEAKLHTGLDANDFYIANIKMWMKHSIGHLKNSIKSLIKVICHRSREEMNILMPGYSHMRKMLPIRWSHWLMSHAWFLEQDLDRFSNSKRRIDVSPFANGGIGGNPYGFNRSSLARDLGFAGGCTPNSINSIGNRDFVMEFFFCNALLGSHLSRFAEDLLLFSSEEFSFVILDQKNTLEVIRGSVGQMIGNYVSCMTNMKGLSSGFCKEMDMNRDEIFATSKKSLISLNGLKDILQTMRVDEDNCSQALQPNILLKDIFFYFITKGKLENKDALHLTSKIEAMAKNKEENILSLTLEEFQSISPLIQIDFLETLSFESSVDQYHSVGGTDQNSVNHQITELLNMIEHKY